MIYVVVKKECEFSEAIAAFNLVDDARDFAAQQENGQWIGHNPRKYLVEALDLQ